MTLAEYAAALDAVLTQAEEEAEATDRFLGRTVSQESLALARLRGTLLARGLLPVKGQGGRHSG